MTGTIPTEGSFIYLADLLRAFLKTKSPEGQDIKNGHVTAVLGSLEQAEAKLNAVREVHARYFDTELDPGDTYSTPEPEDVWRYDRDLREALGE